MGYCPYGDTEAAHIQALRSEQRLCAEILLGSAGSKYPPRSLDELLALVAAVEASEMPQIAEARAIYYILLAYSADATGDDSVAAHFAKEIGLAQVHTLFVLGLWRLDHSEYEPAVAALSAPWQDFVEDADAVLERIARALRPRPDLLVVFLESRVLLLSDTALEDFVGALIQQGRAFRVLELARARRDFDILNTLGARALENRELARSVVQLPVDIEEWAELSAAMGDSDAARELRLVRALHVGDLQTISTLKDDPRFALLTKGTAEV